MVPVLVGDRGPWDQATRAEARDFCRWMQLAGKPPGRTGGRRSGGQPPVGGYSPSVRAHCETVLRCFYEFHLDAGTGPIVNPFPLDRSRRAGRGAAHHNPMEPLRNERAGLYRPRLPSRIPRSVPDAEFNEIFARLPSHRDRALVAFYVSTGARASELLSVTQGGVDPGRQLIAVVRKGTRPVQELPASTDAFVWLRLYQLEMDGLIPAGRRQPLWWTLAAPGAAADLSRGAPHVRAGRTPQAGTAATLHSLRHTAAYRMAEDPALPLTDVQLRPRPRPAHHHADLPDAAQGGRDPPDAGPSRRAGPAAAAAGSTGPGAWLPARRPGRPVRRGRTVTVTTAARPAGRRPPPAPARVRFARPAGQAGLAGHGPGPAGGAGAPDRAAVRARRPAQPVTLAGAGCACCWAGWKTSPGPLAGAVACQRRRPAGPGLAAGDGPVAAQPRPGLAVAARRDVRRDRARDLR